MFVSIMPAIAETRRPIATTSLIVLLMVSALCSGALYLWSHRLLLSWLTGAIAPYLAFQWLNERINGPDAFELWRLAVTLACTLFVDILLLAVLAYVAAEDE